MFSNVTDITENYTVSIITKLHHIYVIKCFSVSVEMYGTELSGHLINPFMSLDYLKE